MQINWLFTASTCVVAAALLAASPALAASAPEADSRGAGLSATGDAADIVVTARRKPEALQNVPETVNVVTSEALGKLKVTQFADLQGVVSGLTLSQDNTGYSTAASMRGVTFDVNTKAPPTVAMYLDDVSVQSLFLFSSLYDIGQVEVLRGPQGTTRGVSAPSGAITVSTRKPDLSALGGYVDGTVTTHRGANLQGALNIPLVRDVLALRVAGEYDLTDANAVRSINNPARPKQETVSARASLFYKPGDDFSALVSYSHLEKHLHAFDQVSGPGQGTAAQPAITPGQMLSVEDGISNVYTHLDFVTAQIDAQLLGQHLTYNGSYQNSYIYSGQQGDPGNIIPGAELPYAVPSGKHETTQEIRIASNPAPHRLFDYVAGFYFDHTSAWGHIDEVFEYLPGAFGSPGGTPGLAAFNPAYQLPLTAQFPYTSREASLFGSLTLHLGDQTELSAGVRHIWSDTTNVNQTTIGTGLIAIPAIAVSPAPSCAAAGLGSAYPGYCDYPIPATVVPAIRHTASEQPTIYNVSLSHRFSNDLMVYANTGSAFRPAQASVGIQGALAVTTNPLLTGLNFQPSEHSTNYEIGFKASFLERRGHLNVSLYDQKFHNLTIYVPNVYYNDGGYPVLWNFTDSVNATIKGFDVDFGYKFSKNFNVSLQANYADDHVDGSQVPCNTYSGYYPSYNTDGLISLCPGSSVSRAPRWNATLQAEYSHPVRDGLRGFLRGLLSYQAKNVNRVEPNFSVSDYAIVNLYAGLHSEDGGWELTAFVRNAFDTKRTLDVSPAAYNLNQQLGPNFPTLIPAAGSGYYATTVTRPREFGISLRYAFGSR